MPNADPLAEKSNYMPVALGKPSRIAQSVKSTILAFGLLCLGFGSAVASETTSKPIFHPESGSYFELFEVPGKCGTKGHCSRKWSDAYREVSTKSYEGRRGRLAIVDSAETYRFLRDNFRVKYEAWIGLRYFCRTRTLKWVDGQDQPRIMKVWARQWRYSWVSCGTTDIAYMPVWITPAFQFQAAGQNKAAWFYFIEYPDASKSATVSTRKTAGDDEVAVP